MRTWDTRVGTIELAIPKVRPGHVLPVVAAAAPARGARAAGGRAGSLRARRLDAEGRRADEGAWARTASRSRRCRGSAASSIRWSRRFGRGRSRPSYPYIWVDATYHKVRVNGRVTSQATVVAVGVTSEGERQVLGIDVGPSEDRAFWTAFLRSLVKRGLRGVRLVTSDAHEGLKQAIATVLSGATWQRCRVHFMRNLLATVPKGAREAIAAVVRTIFAQPDHATAMTQLRKVADGLRAPLCAGRRAARGRGRGHPGVPAPAARASAAAAQHESAGAAEQGDQAAVERRRHLPDAAVGDPPGRRDSARAGRRMGRGRAPLLQCGVDEAAHGADAAGDRAGDLRGDCVKTRNRCGRLWKPLCGFQAAVDGALSVHGCGSVHAVVELREDVRDLHHLTGHYLEVREILRTIVHSPVRNMLGLPASNKYPARLNSSTLLS